MDKKQKKALYESIMKSVAKTVKKALMEADELTQEEKMKLWHQGKRGQNVGALSDEKLLTNLQICLDNGYDEEADELKDEAESRGLVY